MSKPGVSASAPVAAQVPERAERIDALRRAVDDVKVAASAELRLVTSALAAVAAARAQLEKLARKRGTLQKLGALPSVGSLAFVVAPHAQSSAQGALECVDDLVTAAGEHLTPGAGRLVRDVARLVLGGIEQARAAAAQQAEIAMNDRAAQGG